MIFHITKKSWWQKWMQEPHYESETFLKEGFIHCAIDAQVEGVIHRYFAGQTDLLLLHIEPSKLIAKLKYEMATGGELFPHVYGHINKEAIVKAESILF